MSKPQIDIKTTLEARKLFKAKNWSLESSRFESFMHCLSLLNDDEKQLLLSLTEKFKEIGISSHIRELHNAYDKIPKHKVNGAEKIFIYPLTRFFEQKSNKEIKKIDAKPKSGERMYSLLSSDKVHAFRKNKKLF